MPAGAGTDGGGGPGPRAREILTPSIVYAFRRRKPVPIVPPHEPLRVGKVLRSLQEVPSGGGMGPGFRRESEEYLLTACSSPYLHTLPRRDDKKFSEAIRRSPALWPSCRAGRRCG